MTRCVVLVVMGFLCFQILFLYVMFTKHSVFQDSISDIRDLTMSSTSSFSRMVMRRGSDGDVIVEGNNEGVDPEAWLSRKQRGRGAQLKINKEDDDNGDKRDAKEEDEEDAENDRRSKRETHRRPDHRIHSSRREEDVEDVERDHRSKHRRNEGDKISVSLSNLPVPVSPYRTFPVHVIPPEHYDGLTAMPPSNRALIENAIGEIIGVDFPDLQYRTSSVVRESLPRIFHELPQYGFDPEYKNPCWARPLKEGESANLSPKACLPYAYILGQPKCGTSDIFERLKSHQDVIMPRRKEVRWFTRGEFTTSAIPHEGDEDGPEVTMHKEHLIGKETSVYTFTRHFNALADMVNTPNDHTHNAPSKKMIAIDGGPHTLWWPTQSPDGAFLPKDIPPVQILREMQPQAMFLVTLCDPVKRMYSDYYFLDDNLRPVRGESDSKSAQQFHERTVSQIAGFQQCVRTYMDILIPQYESQYKGKETKKPTIGNIGLNDEIFEQYPHLWFRASQM